jgi:hypothetical protein
VQGAPTSVTASVTGSKQDTDNRPGSASAVQDDAGSAFTQMIAQIVAEAAGIAPSPASSTTGQTPPAKLAPLVAYQSPDLPAPASMPFAGRTTEATMLPPPVAPRKDSRETTVSKHAGTEQAPAVPVEVTIPVPVIAKLVLPSFGGGASADDHPVPVQTATAPDVPETAPIVLQPKPFLEVKLKFDQVALNQVTPSYLQYQPQPQIRTEALAEGPSASQPPIAAPLSTETPDPVRPVTSELIFAKPVAGTSPVPATPDVPPAPLLARPALDAAPLATPSSATPVVGTVAVAPAAPDTPAPAARPLLATLSRATPTPMAVAPFRGNAAIEKPGSVASAPLTPTAPPVAPSNTVTASSRPDTPALKHGGQDVSSRADASPTAIQSASGDRHDADRAATGQQNSDQKEADPEPQDVRQTAEGNPRPQAHPASAQETPAVGPLNAAIAGGAASPAHSSPVTSGDAVAAVPQTSPTLALDKGAKPETQTSNAPAREEPLPDPAKTQQPVRSLSLEFAPDGARDIKVRLSERAGDVHISLHGTDPSLASRVREGVSDLVGSLSRAGYDAEAWTPGQGSQNQRQQQQQEQRKTPRNTSGGASAEEFNGILQQPVQEIS